MNSWIKFWGSTGLLLHSYIYAIITFQEVNFWHSSKICENEFIALPLYGTQAWIKEISVAIMCSVNKFNHHMDTSYVIYDWLPASRIYMHDYKF